MTAEELRKLAPHQSVFSLDKPRAISKNLSMPNPVVATIASWIHSYHDETPDPEKLRRMEQIPDAD
jgi:hypothetical protein